MPLAIHAAVDCRFLGGTGVGSYFGANTGLIYGLFTGYFIVGIRVGIYPLDRKPGGEDAVCELPK